MEYRNNPPHFFIAIYNQFYTKPYKAFTDAALFSPSCSDRFIFHCTNFLIQLLTFEKNDKIRGQGDISWKI